MQRAPARTTTTARFIARAAGARDAQRDVPGGFSQGSVGFAPFRGGGQSGGNSIEHRLREGVLRMLRGSAGRQLLLTKVVAELYKESDEYRAYVTKIGSAKKVFARDEWKGLVACHLPEGYAKGNEVLELRLVRMTRRMAARSRGGAAGSCRRACWPSRPLLRRRNQGNHRQGGPSGVATAEEARRRARGP